MYPNPPNKPAEVSPKKMEEDILGKKKYKIMNRHVSERLIQTESQCADCSLCALTGWFGCITGAIRKVSRQTSMEITIMTGSLPIK